VSDIDDKIRSLTRRIAALEAHDQADMTGRYSALVQSNAERSARLWGIAKIFAGVIAGALSHWLINR